MITKNILNNAKDFSGDNPIVTIFREYLNKIKELDDILSPYAIYTSSSKKWVSFKVENKNLLKIIYQSKFHKYTIQIGNNEIQVDEYLIDDILKDTSRYKETIYLIWKELSSRSTDEMFGCCSHYIECSDQKKCVKDNDFSRNCYYRKNLEAGRIFYGKNKNN